MHREGTLASARLRVFAKFLTSLAIKVVYVCVYSVYVCTIIPHRLLFDHNIFHLKPHVN